MPSVSIDSSTDAGSDAPQTASAATPDRPTVIPSAAEQMTRAEKMRVLGEMASGIIHDVNNMLGAILGRAQMVRLKTDLDEIKRQVAQIEKIAVQGGETVKRLLEFTRHGQAGEFKAVDLNQVVADALEVTRHRWEAQAQQHGIVYTVTTRLAADPVIRGVHSELIDVVANMVLNALDAMPEGGPLVLETKRNNNTCQLSVTDEGVGMSPEQTAQVFLPFFTTKGAKGSGLGLAVVYAVVTRHGGRIHVESAVGKGSRFVLEWPSADGPLPGAVAETPEHRTAGKRVLLVDDDPMILDVIGEALREVGHEVVGCDSGAAALTSLQERPFDVVVTDLGMPGVTGWEVARHARDMKPRLPVVIISGWGTQIDAQRLSDYGIDELLAKPFRLEQIRNTIARVTQVADPQAP